MKAKEPDCSAKNSTQAASDVSDKNSHSPWLCADGTGRVGRSSYTSKQQYNFRSRIHRRAFFFSLVSTSLKLNAAAAINFKPVADLLSKSIIAHNEMALCLIDMGKPKEARALLNTLVTHAPLNADAISNIGLSYEREMKLDKDYEHFSRAFELSGEGKFAANAAVSLQGQGKKEDARAFWSKSIQADPENPAGYQNYMHITKGQEDDTIFKALKQESKMPK